MNRFENLQKALGLIATKQQHSPVILAGPKMAACNRAMLETFTNQKPVYAMVNGRRIDVKRAVSRRVARYMGLRDVDWKAVWTSIIEFVDEHWWEILKIAISIMIFMI